MDNKSYADAVNAGNYPEDIRVPLDKPFVDNRGTIQNLWLGSSGSITFIESKTGAKRASHIHTLDHHSCYVIEGKIKYTEIDNNVQTDTIFSTGEMFFTRPGVYHEMFFLEPTKMITVNNMVKNHETYEGDIVRPNK